VAWADFGRSDELFGLDMAWLVYQGSFKLVRTFTSPQTSLGDLNAASMARLIGMVSDITLILDGDGVILDAAFQSRQLLDALNDSAGWVSQTFGSIVAADSRTKTAALLQDAMGHATPKWRHINHKATDGRSIPVLYCGVKIGGSGRVMAFGRDLSAVSTLQQRLLNAQQSVERDYARLRDIEGCYRLLFQQSSEAVLVLDPAKSRIIEANPAANAMFRTGTADVTGRPLSKLFGTDNLAALQSRMDGIPASDQSDDVPMQLAQDGPQVRVRMSLFRQENTTLLLMCITPVHAMPYVPVVPDDKAILLRAVESAPDAFVVTDDNGDVISANAAFVEMVQLLHEDEVVGQPLDRWIGEGGVGLGVLTANLRRRGAMRCFRTTVRGEHGSMAQVEMSAVPTSDDERWAVSYAIRNVSARLDMGLQSNPFYAGPQGIGAPAKTGRQLTRSVEQLTELIGRVSLRDLVRESTEVIERLAIEAALELTHSNRTLAAEMLGLSRQSLYVKLRRYGIDDLAKPERH